MTTPHGYADYQNYPLWRGAALYANTTTIHAGAPLIVTGYVAQFSALQLFLTDSTGGTGVSVTITWYTDATLAFAQGSYTTATVTGATLSAVIPNVGNYVQIIVATSSVPNVALSVSIVPVNVPASKPAYNVVGNAVSLVNQGIVSGFTQVNVLPYVAEGTGYLWVQSVNIGIVYTAHVQQLDGNGNVLAELWNALATNQPTTAFFQAGATAVQFSIQNNDAATQHFNTRCGILAA